MAEGLIDKLPVSHLVSADVTSGGVYVRKDDLLDLLRSDEIREALADAVDSALGAAILGRQAPKPLVVDAVVRVLTGKAVECDMCIPECAACPLPEEAHR